MKHRLILRCATALLASAGLTTVGLVGAGQTAGAATVPQTLHFDELPTQPVNGLSFMGVTFGFTVAGVASTDANYNGSGPPQQADETPPVLEGNAQGTLTITFTKPTKTVGFGLLLNTPAKLPDGATVNLYNAHGHLRSSTQVATAPVGSDLYTEALFSATGKAVKTMVLTFDSTDAARFALDNLTYLVRAPRHAAALPSSSGTRW